MAEIIAVVQGAGAGGMLTLSQIILSDLVSLQERGTYNGLLGLYANFFRSSPVLLTSWCPGP